MQRLRRPGGYNYQNIHTLNYASIRKAPVWNSIILQKLTARKFTNESVNVQASKLHTKFRHNLSKVSEIKPLNIILNARRNKANLAAYFPPKYTKYFKE
jgi:hypothetical protein